MKNDLAAAVVAVRINNLRYEIDRFPLKHSHTFTTVQMQALLLGVVDGPKCDEEGLMFDTLFSVSVVLLLLSLRCDDGVF